MGTSRIQVACVTAGLYLIGLKTASSVEVIYLQNEKSSDVKWKELREVMFTDPIVLFRRSWRWLPSPKLRITYLFLVYLTVFPMTEFTCRPIAYI